MTSKTTLQILSIVLAGVFVGTSIAQESKTATDAAQQVQAEPTSGTVDQPEAVESDEEAAVRAMDELLNAREAAPVIEPMRTTTPGSQPELVSSAASVDIDPAVLGIAPGDEPPPLRREGEFIINRRGRLIHSVDSGHRLFVLESDASHSPELPLVLQACQLLETMENTVDRRGDTTIFILSGQIHTYRGANYLLPTMMKTAANTGNLTN